MTDSAFEQFYNAILAYHAGDTVQALAFTEKAQAEGRDKVYVEWVEDIEAARFETPHTELIYNYWWAPAFLLCAKRKA